MSTDPAALDKPSELRLELQLSQDLAEMLPSRMQPDPNNVNIV